LQTFNDSDCGIVRITYSAQELVDGVIEPTKTREIIVEVVRGSLEWLEERHWRQCTRRDQGGAKKPPGGVDGKKRITAGNQEKSGKKKETNSDHDAGEKHMGHGPPYPYQSPATFAVMAFTPRETR